MLSNLLPNDLEWISLPVSIRNIRTSAKTEHPLSILQAICKFAASKAGISSPWFIHPHEVIPDKMHRDAVFNFSIIFTQHYPFSSELITDHAVCMAKGLSTHLSDPRNNFGVEHIGSPSRVLFSSLAKPLPVEDEICLHFITPLPFIPKDKKRKWLITNKQFFSLFKKRFSTCFGLDISSAAPLFEELTLLPYFWQYFHAEHISKSALTASHKKKPTQYFNGMRGSLYVKGNILPLLPLFQLGEAIHISGKQGGGLGCYQLHLNKPFFDKRLQNKQTRKKAWLRMQDKTDAVEMLPDNPRVMKSLTNRIFDGRYQHSPAVCYTIPKSDGRRRCVGTLEPEDAFVHKLLHTTLAPTFDRMFQHASVGFRRGKSVDTAIEHIEKGVAAGRKWVVESDIAAFFDSINRSFLEKQLDTCIPKGDVLTRSLLFQCIDAPRVPAANSSSQPLPDGLLQGSPLSPLLANLYLDPFDQAVEKSGNMLIRYADDFVILTKDQAEAEKALELTELELAKRHLSINHDKTTIHPVAEGFGFLGRTIGNAQEAFAQEIARESIRKTLYITRQYISLGLDYDALLVREKGDIVSRTPLQRVGEIVVLGTASLSTKLLQRCAKKNVPVSICGYSGQYISTLRPESRHDFDILLAHGTRHSTVSDADQLTIAQELITAKISNYRSWLKRRWPKESFDVCSSCKGIINNLQHAPSLESIRGHEGQAAHILHRYINQQIKYDFFTSPKRIPYQKQDPWNALQDFLSYLLFTRLNVLVRGKGLNPFLGFLHSSKANYESLICDLQEPFRYSMDRLMLSLINRQQITPDHFEENNSKWKMTGKGMNTVLQAFEKELVTSRANQAGTLKQLLTAQVRLVSRWALEDDALRWHRLPQR